MHVRADLVHEDHLIAVFVNHTMWGTIRDEILCVAAAPILYDAKHQGKLKTNLLLNFCAMLACRSGGKPKSNWYMWVNGSVDDARSISPAYQTEKAAKLTFFVLR